MNTTTIIKNGKRPPSSVNTRMTRLLHDSGSVDSIRDHSHFRIASIDAMTPLINTFAPGPKDVICGHNSAAKTHQGNIYFKNIIGSKVEQYAKAVSKLDKSLIVSSIVDKIRDGSPEGGFVKKKNGKWYEVCDQLAREKVGQLLRESLHSQYRSSTNSKKRRRLARVTRFDDEFNLVVQAHSKKIKFVIQKTFKDDEIETFFNQANCNLLQVFKQSPKKF